MPFFLIINTPCLLVGEVGPHEGHGPSQPVAHGPVRELGPPHGFLLHLGHLLDPRSLVSHLVVDLRLVHPASIHDLRDDLAGSVLVDGGRGVGAFRGFGLLLLLSH